MQAEIFYILDRAFPDAVDFEDVMSGIYGILEGSSTSVRNQAHYLRKAVEPLGLGIEGFKGTYRLTDKTAIDRNYGRER
jgi:hypothetical protein